MPPPNTLYLSALPFLFLFIFLSTSHFFPNQSSPFSLSLFKPSSPSPEVQIGQGIIVGTIIDEKYPAPVEAFLGIPYAQPPVGELRFRRAVKVQASDERVSAGKWGYIIGALGFLPSKLTFEENIVNLGLHDQVFLLQWVQDNIEAFGGDKNDVTIFGLSAGAHSIGHHILNYKEGTKPLFHKAILESGAPTSRAVHPYDAPIHAEQFALFLNLTNCSSPPPPSSPILECLRTLPSKSITTAQTAVFDTYNPSLRWAFQPVIDHELIHGRPIDVWKSGKWNRVPIMTGHATNEGTFYVPRQVSTSEEFTDFWRTLLPHFTESDLKRIEELYPDPETNQESVYREERNMSALGIGSQFKRLEASYAQYAYICPVLQTASIVSFSSSSTDKKQAVYVFHWAVNSSVLGGANHGDNMYYESFQESITSISERQKEISGVYHGFVTSFITSKGGDLDGVEGRFGKGVKWGKFKGRNGEERKGQNRKGKVGSRKE
ncbi:hypothetical protein G7Y89_g12469 [Cudoniella acicularis]|uniref:Carboxylic ester hydrolase n=1 Tax=Cudoniella acicularis TaxID=354080 RepID=A0A8H4R8R8_9HELO|nr:hypothetical protein G7Y89_g12469 [Cudoniella acicularis]